MAYYALAENAWNAAAKRSEAQIVHNFGRADQVDREGLKRLVDSINRVLDQDDAVTRGAQEIPQIELDRVFELGVVLAAWYAVVITNDDTLSAEDVALGYKGAWIIEACFRRMKQTGLEVRPMSHTSNSASSPCRCSAPRRSAAPCHGRALRMNSPPSRPSATTAGGGLLFSGRKSLRIPTKPAIDSDRNQPPIPIEASQAFRRKPARVAVWSEGGNIRLRSQPTRQVWRFSLRAVYAMISL